LLARAPRWPGKRCGRPGGRYRFRWRRSSRSGCDTLLVDAVTATPDADFSSAAERELEELGSRVADVLKPESLRWRGVRCCSIELRE
jgi:hypothetical protein